MYRQRTSAGQRLLWHLRHPFRWQDPHEFLVGQDQHLVEMALKEARQNTAAEVRLVVLGAASRHYWELPAFLALLLAVLAHFLAGVCLVGERPIWLNEAILVLVFLVSYPLLGLVLPTWQRRQQEVERAANWLAYQHKTAWSRSELGVLVVVCLLEKQVGLWTGDQVDQGVDEGKLHEIFLELKRDLHRQEGRAGRLDDNLRTVGYYLGRKLPSETGSQGVSPGILVQLTPCR